MAMRKADQYTLGGVDSRSNPANYPPERSLRCRNFTPLPSGQLRLRYGYTKPAQVSTPAPIHSAAYYQQYGGSQFVLYGQGSQLKQVAIGTGTTTTIATLSTGNPWGYYRAANRIFIGNGQDLESWDGTTLRSVGRRPPSAAETSGITVSAVSNSSATFATTLLSGYQLFMVYFNPVTGAVGNRVPIGNPVTIGTTTTALFVNGLPDLSGINGEWVKGFGRTNDGGQVPYWLIDANGNRVVANNTATTATIISSVIDTNQELPFRNGVPISGLNAFAKVGSKIFGIRPGDVNIYYTEDDTNLTNGIYVGVPAESWPPDNVEPFPTAEVPTTIHGYNQEAWIFSQNYLAIWSLFLFQQGQNPWRAIWNVGCAGQRAWIDTPYGPHWVTPDKQLMGYNGTGPTPVSEEYEASLLGRIGDQFIGQVELAYYRNIDLGIDRIYILAKDANGNPFVILHDFRLRDFRNSIAQGYEAIYSGMSPNTMIGSGYTPRQNVRDVNGRERLWTGATDGNLYQLEDGNSDNGNNYTGDAIFLIGAGDGKPLLDSIQWQGDGNVQVSVAVRATLQLSDFESRNTEVVEIDNPDNRYKIKVGLETRWVYARFQLTSHPQDGDFEITDPPFVPMPSYGTINVITPDFGRTRANAP